MILQQVGKFARVGLLAAGLWQGAAAPIKAPAPQTSQPIACCCGTGHCQSHVAVRNVDCNCGCQMQSQKASPTAQKPTAIVVERTAITHVQPISPQQVVIEAEQAFQTLASHVLTRFANAPPGRSPPLS